MLGCDCDVEFEDVYLSVVDFLICWDEGWQVFLDVFDYLCLDDLMQILIICGEVYIVFGVVEWVVLYVSGYVFQFIFLVKILCGVDFQIISILCGGLGVYNVVMWGGIVCEQ